MEIQGEDGKDLGVLPGRAVRLKFEMRNADLYALRFVPEAPEGT